ncbi:lipase member M [Tribolium castaneum]|uniref:Lipase n=1 Tax=Tribolium castaneum TaxID=7070 RepID=A0A139WAQ5_TRICA|nr:PREDICTED: lipase member M-like [Tribolium castaneum]KYB25016.1 Lipase 1-like Protein [Tribolium castaneum]|eukprot:XP_015839621.1 PREDICTED: lipase member M-like [Tribolium castaneum]
MLPQKLLFYSVLPILVLIFHPLYTQNNTCRTYFDYINIFTGDCYYNPDIDSDSVQVIQRYIGIHEEHTLQTDDGYILTLIRIPRKNAKEVILLQHSFLADSKIWVSQFNESVAFLFWRAGFDVWLSNSRGTFYSQKHVTLNINNPSFWNYSFHELGYYDLSAQTKYITRATQRAKIVYLGYSMGGTIGLVYGSTKPEEAAHLIKLAILIAPCSHFSPSENLLKFFVPLYCKIHEFSRSEVTAKIMPSVNWQWKIYKGFHFVFPFKKSLAYIIGLIHGWTPDESDPKFSHALLACIRSAVPLKLVLHYTQIYKSGGHLLMYDYGDKNLELYGQKEPPLYPLDKIKVPIFLIHSLNDLLSTPDDNEYLYSLLSDDVKIYGKLKIEGLNHADFAFGRHRNERVYEKILELLKRID